MRRSGSRWQTAPVVGAVLMILLLVVVMPIGILLSGAVVAALLGGLLKRDVDDAYQGSEPVSYTPLTLPPLLLV